VSAAASLPQVHRRPPAPVVAAADCVDDGGAVVLIP
jgi:hypothetical protein